MTIRAGRLVVLSPIRLAQHPVMGGTVLAGKPISYTPSKDGLRVWSGEGPPPPEPPLGIAVGDTYVDTLTGTIWRLDPGE